MVGHIRMHDVVAWLCSILPSILHSSLYAAWQICSSRFTEWSHAVTKASRLLQADVDGAVQKNVRCIW